MKLNMFITHCGRYLVFMLPLCIMNAQKRDVHPTFDVASVKAIIPLRGERLRVGCHGGPGDSDPSRLTCNTDLAGLVTAAYGLRFYQFTPPSWMRTTLFNVVASIPEGTTREQFRLMMQNLLSERFKMAVHFEKRALPAYVLTVAKSGPKFREATSEAPAADGVVPGDMQWANGRVNHKAKETMEQFAAYLSARTRRPVVDQTGLSKTYGIALEYGLDESATPMMTGAAEVANAPDPDANPALLTALQAQLGLKLQSTTTIVDVLVVDRAESVPTEN